MTKGLDFPVLSRLRFRQLALVVCLADTRNLHAAAREVNLSQPGATKMLKELEAALGVLLFERHARGMIVTRAGEEVVRYARSILSDAARMRDSALAVQSGTSGLVRMGAIPAAVSDLMVDLINLMRSELPALNLDLRVVTSDRLIDGLVEGRFDIGLGRPVDTMRQTGLTFESLLPEDLTIVAAGGWRPVNAGMTDETGLTLKDLIASEWILQPKPSPMRAAVDLAFARAGLPVPRHQIETSSTLATAMLLEKSDLLSVLPLGIANFCARHNLLQILPVEISAEMNPYGMIFPERGVSEAAVSAIAALIRRIATVP